MTYLVDKFSDLTIEIDDSAPNYTLFTFSTGETFKFESENGKASDYKTILALKFVSFLQEDFVSLEA